MATKSKELDEALTRAIVIRREGGSFDVIVPSDNPASPFAKVQVVANSMYSPADITAFVSNVWVRDDKRRMGFASAIYDKIEEILAKEGKILVPSNTLKRAGYEFWRNRDPAAVANDLRSHEPEVQAWAERKFGKGVRLEFRDGGETVDVYKGGRSVYSASRGELVDEGVFALRAEGAELARERAVKAVAKEAEKTSAAKAAEKTSAAKAAEKTSAAKAAEKRQIKPSATLQLDIITPNAGVLRTTMLNTPMQGAPLADWIAELEEADVRRANRVITNGILTGKSSDEIATELLGSKSLQYKDGVRTVTERGAEALVRTATNHAANVGRQSVWEENVDIIDKVRWVSTLDSRTSPTCRERDGKTYPVDKGPRPPAHVRCRSTTVAVVKSWEDLGFAVDELDAGTRASIDGQVPADMTYYDWLSKQSAATQKDVLGATRYDLWKKGGVNPDRFYDDGRYMTLDEMRVKLRPLGRGRIALSAKQKN